MSTVYDRVKDSLSGLSYRQFTKYVWKFCSMPDSRSAARWRRGGLATGNKIAAADKMEPATAASINRQKKELAQKSLALRGFEPGPKVPNINELF